MRIGALNRRVQLCRRDVQRDPEGGEDVGVWKPYGSCAAGVTVVGGREGLEERQTVARTDRVFRVRWRRDVTVEDRIVYEGKAYDIVDVREVGNREGLDLVASARAEG